MSDLKQKIISAAKKLESVEVPEWGVTVYLCRMTAGERDVFMRETEARKATNDFFSLDRLLVVLTLCDASGVRQFDNPDELKDADSLVLERLCKRAMYINGLTDEAREDIKKKLNSAENAGSSSSLPKA